MEPHYSILYTLYSMIIGVTHATTVTLSYLILTLEVTMNHESNRTPLLVQDISSSGMLMSNHRGVVVSTNDGIHHS